MLVCREGTDFWCREGGKYPAGVEMDQSNHQRPYEDPASPSPTPHNFTFMTMTTVLQRKEF